MFPTKEFSLFYVNVCSLRGCIIKISYILDVLVYNIAVYFYEFCGIPIPYQFPAIQLTNCPNSQLFQSRCIFVLVFSIIWTIFNTDSCIIVESYTTGQNCLGHHNFLTCFCCLLETDSICQFDAKFRYHPSMMHRQFLILFFNSERGGGRERRHRRLI